MITTNRLDEVGRLSDRVAVLHRGRLVAADAPAALMATSDARVLVTFELMKPQVPLAAVLALDNVIDAAIDRAHYTLVSHDGPATLRAVLRLLEGLAIRPVSLGMRQQTLEDAFLALTRG